MIEQRVVNGFGFLRAGVRLSSEGGTCSISSIAVMVLDEGPAAEASGEAAEDGCGAAVSLDFFYRV